jgi:hypothetical protein
MGFCSTKWLIPKVILKNRLQRLFDGEYHQIAGRTEIPGNAALLVFCPTLKKFRRAKWV